MRISQRLALNKDVTDDKIAMIAMCWRIFGALITHDYWPLNGGWPLDHGSNV